MSHKRYLDRHGSLAFRAPSATCYACYDTGLITNGDGLVNQYLPDYDMVGLNRVGGSDLALICHCSASRVLLDDTGKQIRGGFRTDFGDIRKTTTDRGDVAVGADIAPSTVKEIHRRRSELWQETEKEMNRARQAKTTGHGDPMPWFIAEVKAQIETTRATAPRGTGSLQSLGSVLGDVIDVTAT